LQRVNALTGWFLNHTSAARITRTPRLRLFASTLVKQRQSKGVI